MDILKLIKIFMKKIRIALINVKLNKSKKFYNKLAAKLEKIKNKYDKLILKLSKIRLEQYSIKSYLDDLKG